MPPTRYLFKLRVETVTCHNNGVDFIWGVLTKKTAALQDIRSSYLLLPPPPPLQMENMEDELSRVGGIYCVSFLRFYQDSGGPALLLSLWK